MARNVFLDCENCAMPNKRVTRNPVGANLGAWHLEDCMVCLLRLRRYVQFEYRSLVPVEEQVRPSTGWELSCYRIRVITEDAVPPFDDRALMDTTPHGGL